MQKSHLQVNEKPKAWVDQPGGVAWKRSLNVKFRLDEMTSVALGETARCGNLKEDLLNVKPRRRGWISPVW